MSVLFAERKSKEKLKLNFHRKEERTIFMRIFIQLIIVFNISNNDETEFQPQPCIELSPHSIEFYYV